MSERQTQHITRWSTTSGRLAHHAGKITLRQERIAGASVIERAVEAIRPVAEARTRHHGSGALTRRVWKSRAMTGWCGAVQQDHNASKFNQYGGQGTVTGGEKACGDSRGRQWQSA